MEIIAESETLIADPENAADYWLRATLGEAHVLLNDVEAATRCYLEAVTRERRVRSAKLVRCAAICSSWRARWV